MLGEVSRNVDSWVTSDKVGRKVETWRRRIEPILLEEEERGVFDIHEKGEMLLESLKSYSTSHPSSSPSQTLSSLLLMEMEENTNISPTNKQNKNKKGTEMMMGGTSRHETCRAFVATLQLACSGNVEIETLGGGEDVVLLLKHDFDPNQAIDEYRAPSTTV